jgi:rubredoxin
MPSPAEAAMRPDSPEPSETNQQSESVQSESVQSESVQSESVQGNPATATPALRDRHECGTCGYVYIPVQGDERNGIAPNTCFEDLPENWRCPVCSAGKRRFQNIGPMGSVGFKANASYGFGVNTMDPGRKNLLIFGSLFLIFLFFLSLYGIQ